MAPEAAGKAGLASWVGEGSRPAAGAGGQAADRGHLGPVEPSGERHHIRDSKKNTRRTTPMLTPHTETIAHCLLPLSPGGEFLHGHGRAAVADGGLSAGCEISSLGAKQPERRRQRESVSAPFTRKAPRRPVLCHEPPRTSAVKHPQRASGRSSAGQKPGRGGAGAARFASHGARPGCTARLVLPAGSAPQSLSPPRLWGRNGHTVFFFACLSGPSGRSAGTQGSRPPVCAARFRFLRTTWWPRSG